MKPADVDGNYLIIDGTVSPAMANDRAALNEERQELREERHVEREAHSNERSSNGPDEPDAHVLSGHEHDAVLRSVLEGKLPRNLSWKAVLDLIGRVGRVEPNGGTDVIFHVGTAREFFKKPHESDLGIAEVSRLRSFLHGTSVAHSSRKLEAHERTIVAIDHSSARIFQSPSAYQLDHESNIKPYDPHGFQRCLIHRKEAHYKGDRVPEESSFYEEVAKALLHAQSIILVGHGTGKSSAVDVLAAFLAKHHLSLAERIIAIDDVDLSALTEREIEQLANSYVLDPSGRGRQALEPHAR
ncbi:MAG: hypothetical protein M3Y72_16165 [Acidobacteriota bacterium]|nr:hypothetical protein [Acidobacteriota bacterium]